MRFSYYALSVTYFLALLGLYAVTLVDGVEPGLVVITGAGILISLMLNVSGRRIMPPWAWSILALAAPVFFVVDFLVNRQDPVSSAARLLTVLLAAKLFDLKTNRDHIIVSVTVFFQVLAAAASTVSFVFLPLLVLYTLAIIFAMTVMNIRREVEKRGLGEKAIPDGFFGAPFFLSLLSVTAVSLSITFFLFFLIPRMEVGLLERKGPGTIKVSGFSDTVRLGDIGAVKKDPTVVMRVEPAGGRPVGSLYFRGAVLDRYDGGVWKKAAERGSLLKRSSGIFSLARARGRPVELKILLEPLATEVLFAPGRPLRLAASFRNLWTDSTGTIYLPSPPLSRTGYRVWSIPGAVPDGGPPSPSDLVLPGRLAGRLKPLAMEITGDAEGPVAMARAVKRYLRKNFRYSLSPGAGRGENPVEDFLFYTREGYCEQFASSFVLLMRALGVPARLVTGFLEGRWNDLGNYYIVRQSDAHSWAEVFVNGKGWMRFDPTPPAGLVPYGGGGPLMLYLDYLKLKWSRYIINFTATDQRSLARGIKRGSRGFLDGLRSRLRKKARRSALAAAIAALALLPLVYLILRRKRAGVRGKTPEFYLRMLAILERKGIRKAPEETPSEFAGRIGSPVAARITRIFEALRYGGQVTVDAPEVEELLKRLGEG